MTARFTDEPIIAMIKEQDVGEKTVDVCRRHAMSAATFYRYKSKFGGMEPSDARWLRAHEEENGKLKTLRAEQMLDTARLRGLNSKRW
ncbi:MAG: transposase [Deltaproteobacteria bacterium]